MTLSLPKTIRKELAKNVVKMTLLPSDSTTFTVDLTNEELRKANSVMLKFGSTIAKLINLPEHFIDKVQLSEVITDEASKLYQAIFPDLIKASLRRSGIDDKVAWNFLIITEAGKSQSCNVKSLLLFLISV